MIPNDDMQAAFLKWRGVEDPCSRCHGSGVRVYGSTSTWRGGMGGSMCCHDVCDLCWGTGDAHRKGDDLRAQRDTEEQRIAERAAVLLVERSGARLESAKPAVRAIADEIEKLARGRKERPMFFYNVCTALARVLREGAAD